MGNVDTIIDCGAHDGSDTGYYLSLGKKVVSVDASPRMCQLIRSSYEKYINSGFLKVINCAISGNQEPLTFYESTWSHWNSSHYKIANRLGCASKSYTVESKTLSSIIQLFSFFVSFSIIKVFSIFFPVINNNYHFLVIYILTILFIFKSISSPVFPHQ